MQGTIILINLYDKYIRTHQAKIEEDQKMEESSDEDDYDDEDDLGYFGENDEVI